MDTNDNQPLGRPLGIPLGTDEGQSAPASRPITEPELTQPEPNPIPITEPEQPQAEPQPRPITEPEKTRPKPSAPKKKPGKASTKRTWLIAMIALLIAGCIGGGIYYFLSQKDSRSLNDDEEDTEMVDEEEDMDDEEDMDEEDDTYIVEEADEEEEEAVEEEKAEPAQPTTRRMNLSGDADGYPLALSLEIGPDNRVTGTFNDESTGNTTQVSGTMTNGSIRLTGRGCTFRIAPEGHIYTGTLTKGNGKSQELHLVSR